MPKSNVYEMNRLYQFGPYRYFTKYNIEKMIKESNWKIVEKGVEEVLINLTGGLKNINFFLSINKQVNSLFL